MAEWSQLGRFLVIGDGDHRADGGHWSARAVSRTLTRRPVISPGQLGGVGATCDIAPLERDLDDHY